MSNTCKFGLAWIGDCRQPVPEGNTYCTKHEPVKCSSCGKPATHECGATYQLVCGAPLCNDCTDIGGMKHVKKDSPEYQAFKDRWNSKS